MNIQHIQSHQCYSISAQIQEVLNCMGNIYQALQNFTTITQCTIDINIHIQMKEDNHKNQCSKDTWIVSSLESLSERGEEYKFMMFWKMEFRMYVWASSSVFSPAYKRRSIHNLSVLKVVELLQKNAWNNGTACWY